MIHEQIIHGQGESGRQYITHTRHPRFVAELFDDEDFPIGGVSMALDDEVLANFIWIDPAPESVEELSALRDVIAAAMEEIDFRAEREIEGADDDD